jgi:hypothetical protein
MSGANTAETKIPSLFAPKRVDRALMNLAQASASHETADFTYRALCSTAGRNTAGNMHKQAANMF